MNWKKFIVIILALSMCLSVMAFTALDSTEAEARQRGDLPENGNLLIATRLLPDSDGNRGTVKVQSTSLAMENLAMANISDSADVYDIPDYTGNVLGKIFSNTQVSVISRTGNWAQISTGNLKGYLPCSQLMFGEEGNVLMNAKCGKIATILSDTPLYAGAGTDTEVMGNALTGESYAVSHKEGEWYVVVTEAGNCYLPKTAVSVSVQLQAGLTNEEIVAQQQEMQNLMQQLASGSISAEDSVKIRQYLSANYANYKSISMSAEERDLLSKIVYLEAGDNYEEAMAVVNVIFNRVLDSNYGNTVMDVLTEHRQFTTLYRALSEDATTTDTVNSAIDSAMNGENNIGTATSFRSYGDGTYNYYFGTADFEVQDGNAQSSESSEAAVE